MKMVGITSLTIEMAKHIKSSSKKLKEQYRVFIVFKYAWFGNNTKVTIGDNTFCIEGRINEADFKELSNKALQESGCDGTIYCRGCKCTAILYGKPIKQFIMLQRLVKKYANVNLDWDYFKFVDYDYYGRKIDTSTRYLCYNEDACKLGVDFIRKHRTSKDVLKVKYVLDGDNPHSSSALKLIVETPKGKQKADIMLMV